MEDRWTQEGEERFLAAAGSADPGRARRLYSAALIGSEPALALCGGGNVSLKGRGTDAFGEEIETVLVKSSGFDLAILSPQGVQPPDGPPPLVELSLAALRKARRIPELSDEETFELFLQSRLRSCDPPPSLETLVHAWLPRPSVDHTHAEAILLLSGLADGANRLREALGDDVIVIPYADPGLPLAHAALAAFEKQPAARGMVWLRHGLVTWGDTPRESYRATIELVTRAERYLARREKGRPAASFPLSPESSWSRLEALAPILRGLLARPSGDPDRPHRRVILRSLAGSELVETLSRSYGKDIALTPPLTSDHMVRTGPSPIWIDLAGMEDASRMRQLLAKGLERYREAFRGLSPRVALVAGTGALCAGRDAQAAEAACALTEQALRVKTRASFLGAWEGLAEEHLFRMESHRFQRRKAEGEQPRFLLEGEVALVTGAAGAIGAGVCEALLAEGCHVAATDLPGPALDDLVLGLAAAHPGRVMGETLDVTDPASVRRAVGAVVRRWGGIDIGVANAGIAHVAGLADLDLDRFRRLEQVNVEGTLLVLKELSRVFSLQGTGGDVVLVSTKNVFAPGAGFGAYSATKAAAHQLARIASLEFAPLDVRVNMVAPDAVFSHGGRKSGLWQEVGPERMKARGLDEKGLEEYYRGRNLLKTRVTASHVGRAVVFFASRQTPTTGATLPVDGGLPDATPR